MINRCKGFCQALHSILKRPILLSCSRFYAPGSLGSVKTRTVLTDSNLDFDEFDPLRAFVYYILRTPQSPLLLSDGSYRNKSYNFGWLNGFKYWYRRP